MAKETKKVSRKEIERMKEDIFENILGALLDDGVEYDEAEMIAKDEVNEMTEKQIIKEYKGMTE